MSSAGKYIAVVIAVIIGFGLFGISYFGENETPEAPPTEKPKNVVDVASHTSRLSTFVVAVKSAGLAEKLENQDSYTIFVPTDAAFANLPDKTFPHMMKSGNKRELQDIINHHLIPRIVSPQDLKDGAVLTTANGRKLHVTISGDEMKINDARVIQKSIPAANGVIYVIDKVLLPPSLVQE